VRAACSVLAKAAVNDQFTDFEWLLLAGLGTDFHCAPLSQGNGMSFGSGKADRTQQEKADEDIERAHDVANYMALHQKS
jgi:hypothetical protein